MLWKAMVLLAGVGFDQYCLDRLWRRVSLGLLSHGNSTKEWLCMRASNIESNRSDQVARNRLGLLIRLTLALFCALLIGVPAFSETPTVGVKAPDFTLSTPTGKAVRMSEEQHGHDLVLVILRGFPGYQCPYCVKQVHDFVEHASDFAAKNARVLLVYPGPPASRGILGKKAELDQHAKDFLAKQAELPPNIVLVTDPDYTVTNLYGLRWNAFHETAYPSTFILDKKGMVVFEKISHSHDDRLSAQDALAHLSAN
jgi:thioredoxin-dependent peroxiredoxin